MAKFRKKPVVIEAVQWQPGKVIAGVVGEREATEGGNGLSPEPAMAFIETLEGTMQVRAGDWVITGVKGERYPCKPDIFAATYTQADEPAVNGWGSEPLAQKAGDPRVLINGNPVKVDFRIVSEETYQQMLKCCHPLPDWKI
jgi:hypothetical protein